MSGFRSVSGLIPLKIFRRFFSFGNLPMKGFLRVSGEAAAGFLQGLITNDISVLNHSNSFMHSLVLNVKGRILCDIFVYRVETKADDIYYLLEAHVSRLNALQDYLSKHNLHRKVRIEPDDSVSVWVALPSSPSPTGLQSWLFKNFDRSAAACHHSPSLFFYAVDHRGIAGWSGRVLLPTDLSSRSVFDAIDSVPLKIEDYHLARWRLGLPEGPTELFPNESLPLEANADLSGSISFSKGCYVGQELTARTRFTGVVRRRFVPVQLRLINKSHSNLVATGCHFLNSPVYSASNKEMNQDSSSIPLGWMRAFCHRITERRSILEGIAVLRLSGASLSRSEHVTTLRNISNDRVSMDFALTPYSPCWWPKFIAPELLPIERYYPDS